MTLGRTPLDVWSARRRDLYMTTHDIHKRHTSMPPAGFETTIPATEWTQTRGAATGIGWLWLYRIDLLGCVIVVETFRRSSLYRNCVVIGVSTSRGWFVLTKLSVCAPLNSSSGDVNLLFKSQIVLNIYLTKLSLSLIRNNMVTTNCQQMSGPSAKLCVESETPPARHSVLLTAILLSQQRACVCHSQWQVIDRPSRWDTWDSKKELTKRDF
jgi:hypothetical protein